MCTETTTLDGLIKVEHSGHTWMFDPKNKSEPQVDVGKDYYIDHYKLVYEYSLSGAHEGKPIHIKMIGVKEESDENGIHACFERLVYSDNDEQIEDVIDDFYHDALFEDLNEIARETWD